MNLKEYAEKNGRGTIASLVKFVQVSQPIVSDWVNQKRQVPAERCPDIEAFTGGQVTCEELRPDVNWSVLRKSRKRKRK